MFLRKIYFSQREPRFLENYGWGIEANTLMSTEKAESSSGIACAWLHRQPKLTYRESAKLFIYSLCESVILLIIKRQGRLIAKWITEVAEKLKTAKQPNLPNKRREVKCFVHFIERTLKFCVTLRLDSKIFYSTYSVTPSYKRSNCQRPPFRLTERISD